MNIFSHDVSFSSACDFSGRNGYRAITVRDRRRRREEKLFDAARAHEAQLTKLNVSPAELGRDPCVARKDAQGTRGAGAKGRAGTPMAVLDSPDPATAR